MPPSLLSQWAVLAPSEVVAASCEPYAAVTSLSESVGGVLTVDCDGEPLSADGALEVTDHVLLVNLDRDRLGVVAEDACKDRV